MESGLGSFDSHEFNVRADNTGSGNVVAEITESSRVIEISDYDATNLGGDDFSLPTGNTVRVSGTAESDLSYDNRPLTVGKKGEEALAGGSPDATKYRVGDVVEDTDNPGTVHDIYDDSASGEATAI